MKTPVDPAVKGCDETRRQLLEAAGAVFAQTGFRRATVREICRRAGANVAAVNYHFGGKKTLYSQVLVHAHRKALQKYPLLPGLGGEAPPEQKLRAFIHSLLLRIFDTGPGAWQGKLMSREMIEPTTALGPLVEERLRPMANQLLEIVAAILGRPAGDERVRLCGLSVISQCVFYHHCRPIVSRLFPNTLPANAASVGRLAAHITDFSLAAMAHLSRSKSSKPRK
ncbi:MAG: CerR family C-terminal domain-containing protein [Verrucomicrobia bacterium]|nr:CerR family C-terminal domain-containing protein [Verrucomicrobiota bacterium]MDE3099096.1 CerR family C-terminal domain-containing protein [Verrucomicrobiota bacterium]